VNNVGNNTYGEDIVAKLHEIERLGESDAYILMERIQPTKQYNCKLNGIVGNYCRCEPTVSELGIYGAIIGSVTVFHFHTHSHPT